LGHRLSSVAPPVAVAGAGAGAGARPLDVVVVGSFMMDLVARAARRPATGETVIGSEFQTFLGGKGFNQAVAAARCGAAVGMVGTLGPDEFGARFVDALGAEGIERRWVTMHESVGTGVGLPVVDESGDNAIVVVPRANLTLSPDGLPPAWLDGASTPKVVLLQLELPVPTVVAAARQARQAGALVVLNTAPAPAPEAVPLLVGVADVVVANESEAAALLGGGAGPDWVGAAAEVGRRMEAAAVVLTIGPGGAAVAAVGDGGWHVPGHAVPCLDTVGAGDAFCGALVARLAAGDGLAGAVAFANAAGALAVTREGASPSMPRAGRGGGADRGRSLPTGLSPDPSCAYKVRRARFAQGTPPSSSTTTTSQERSTPDGPWPGRRVARRTGTTDRPDRRACSRSRWGSCRRWVPTNFCPPWSRGTRRPQRQRCRRRRQPSSTRCLTAWSSSRRSVC
jgi:ribokinase